MSVLKPPCTMFTYDQIKDAVKAYAEKPLFNGMEKPYLSGMQEGFTDGAMWAEKQIQAQIEQRGAMTYQTLIEITARLSDVQELIARGRHQDAVDLLNDTKREFWHRANRESAPSLKFDEWLEKNNLFFTPGNPSK